ncbi:hypothetical protein GY24_04165 [Microterricola pindariensis]|uniref:Uncharacterized protein n=1 Tax=Microterricola pindariensis TaxID=478010 RepID=A0ABX5AZR0_9MICO|nr:hypothetical protein GY24_04165 [Microterricola pindariensis]
MVSRRDFAAVLLDGLALEHFELVLTHQLIVGLRDHPMEVVSLQCFVGHVVVVDHLDVVMGMPTMAVDVRDYEHVRVGVQPFCILVAELIHLPYLLGIARIELGVLKALDD